MRKSKVLSLSVFFAALFLVLSMHTFSVRSEAADLYSYTVKVDSGYLALRNAQAYDYNNEIGKLYSGSTVQVYDYNMTSGTYWWVYAPSLGMSGYVNRNYLVNGTKISGDGGSSQNNVIGSTMRVQVSSGYLALRNAKAYDYNNEIGKLYTGDTVTVLGTDDATYWWVYVPATGKYGYVNKNYLVATGERPSGTTMTVKVDSGYLALRNAQAYDYNNEIGKLYTGDTVEVITRGGTYWWVYSAKLGKYGYVNSNYLVSGSSGGSTPSGYGTYQVKVSSGYLALRNAKAFDYYNEIGQLYTGETVEVVDKSDAQYWWVYSNKLGKYGYVNKDYLVYVGSGSSSQQQSQGTTSTWTVHVDSGYLALRNAQAFDYNNEIGKLYNGDVVYVDSSNLTSGTYWWVYAPSLGKSGYVNRNYLY